MTSVLISSVKNVPKWLFDLFVSYIEALDVSGLEVTYFWAVRQEEITPFFLQSGCDYLFRVDAHLLCQPQTLRQLMIMDYPNSCMAIWLHDLLKKPGCYGLGKCQLIKKEVLNLECEEIIATYYPVYPLFEQEDLIGLQIYEQKMVLRSQEIIDYEVKQMAQHAILNQFSEKENNDTYKVNDSTINWEGQGEKIQVLTKVSRMSRTTGNRYEQLYDVKFIRKETGQFQLEYCQMIEENRVYNLTLSMVIKAHQEAYLVQSLKPLVPMLDLCVFFVERASCTELIKEYVPSGAYRVVVLPSEVAKNDDLLREFQWNHTIETGPEWMLFLDGDEVIEEQGLAYIPHLLKEPNVYSYNFRMYSMWDSKHYREDSMWQTHHYYIPFMVRYNVDFDYSSESIKKGSRVPSNTLELPHKSLTIKLKKLELIDQNYRKWLYKEKMLEDPLGKKQSVLYYVSLIDNAPCLLAWQD